jgi:hypothetical protein
MRRLERDSRFYLATTAVKEKAAEKNAKNGVRIA